MRSRPPVLGRRVCEYPVESKPQLSQKTWAPRGIGCDGRVSFRPRGWLRSPLVPFCKFCSQSTHHRYISAYYIRLLLCGYGHGARHALSMDGAPSSTWPGRLARRVVCMCVYVYVWCMPQSQPIPVCPIYIIYNILLYILCNNVSCIYAYSSLSRYIYMYIHIYYIYTCNDNAKQTTDN